MDEPLYQKHYRDVNVVAARGGTGWLSSEIILSALLGESTTD
jgi:hypothetical protein